MAETPDISGMQGTVDNSFAGKMRKISEIYSISLGER